jgi:hypothetical protein
MRRITSKAPNRFLLLLVALSVVGAGLALAASPVAADGTLTPASATVAQGASLVVATTGCPLLEEEGEGSYTVQRAELLLTTGSGAGERLVSFSTYDGSDRYLLNVPGWVDPAQPALVTGRCVRTTLSFEDDTEQVTTLFAYPEVAVDVVAGTAVPDGPYVALDRSTAAGGQALRVTITGCEGAEFAQAVLFDGADLSGRGEPRFVAGSGAGEGAGPGTFELELDLNTNRIDGDAGPVPEGDYGLLAVCGFAGDRFLQSEPQAVSVVGTNPSGAIAVELVDGDLVVSGQACTGGRTVELRYEGYAFDEEFTTARDAAQRLVAGTQAGGGRTGDADLLRQLVVDDEGEISGSATATPEADGTWTVTEALPEASVGVQVRATCGDPFVDGFRYVPMFVSASIYADLYVDRVSPTSSPTGGPITVHLEGVCEGEVRVAILDDDLEVLAESEPITLGVLETGSGTVTAPATPGTYAVAGRCGDQRGVPDAYEVFAPETRSATSPLPEEPATGWPSAGPRATYEGRLGPIDLPAMEELDPEVLRDAARALGPSELFTSVPRPDGDFAITKMDFDLVDAQGRPVGADRAQIDHFVITNRSDRNPACPDGTFALQGAIVGAAGPERTVLQTGDPYGIVVEDDDQWSGTYQLESRSTQDQQVYLAYDITYRRDVANVRPVTTYFGSATGCDRFTWSLDGSGVPDTQSHVITVAKDARLIGAGGHLVEGGTHADWVNDRGRRLCRSEVSYGGDGAIEGISTCPLAEQLRAGERLRFDATYANDEPQFGAMGIFTAYVWEGGGPASLATPAGAVPAGALPGSPSYTG